MGSVSPSGASDTFYTTRSATTICFHPQQENCSRRRRTIDMQKSIRCPILRMTSLSITRPTVCVARSRTAYSGSVWTAWTLRSCTTFPRTSPTSRTAGRSSTKSHARDEGIIRAWGIGVNTPQPILKAINDADPDVCLCARQYSLIDHANAVNEVFPAVREKNVSLVIGSSLNAGFISGSSRYNYGKENFRIPAVVIEKREKLRAVAARYGVDLRTAALQFSAAPDVAVALVVGARSDLQIQEDYNSLQTKIPSEFWAELRQLGLIEANASLPAAPV